MSHGAFFLGRSVDEQSSSQYLATTLVWAHIFFSVSLSVMRSASLFRLQLIARPGRPAGAFRILQRVASQTLRPFILTGVVVAAIGYTFGFVHGFWRSLKFEMYLSARVWHSFIVANDGAARRIDREETMEGSTRPASRRISRGG